MLLTSLKGFTNLQQVSSERDIVEVNTEDAAFDNLRKEIEQVIKFSVLDENVIADNVIDFINFTRNATQRQGYEFEGIFVGAKANSTNQTMNITVLNFLGENSINFTIRLNTSTVQINSSILKDYNFTHSNFTFTAGDNYNLTINLPGKEYEKNITIDTRGNADVYVGFYDIALISSRATHKRTFQQTVRIPR